MQNKIKYQQWQETSKQKQTTETVIHRKIRPHDKRSRPSNDESINPRNGQVCQLLPRTWEVARESYLNFYWLGLHLNFGFLASMFEGKMSCWDIYLVKLDKWVIRSHLRPFRSWEGILQLIYTLIWWLQTLRCTRRLDAVRRWSQIWGLRHISHREVSSGGHLQHHQWPFGGEISHLWGLSVLHIEGRHSRIVSSSLG